MTPTEFNSIATQVQLEIFEKYFEDLNQQLRVPQADIDYADRIASIDEKIAVFKTFGDASYDNTTTPLKPYFTIPSDVYKIGTIVFTPSTGYPVELERLQRSTFYNIEKSNLTRSSESFPTYLYENTKLYVNPKTIQTTLEVDYIRKPANPIWNFTVGNLGQYTFTATDAVVPNPNPDNIVPSIDFELMDSDQTIVILKILLYAGLIIKDPTVIQVAAQQVQSQEVNKKS